MIVAEMKGITTVVCISCVGAWHPRKVVVAVIVTISGVLPCGFVWAERR